MSETAQQYAAPRICAVSATAVDTACLVFSDRQHDLISLEIIAMGIVSDMILPIAVLPDGVEPEDELIITFTRRQCRQCGERKPSSWAAVDLCQKCEIPC